jgi:dTDP-4-amino-4,6-dideoxygalactose transaminase
MLQIRNMGIDIKKKSKIYYAVTHGTNSRLDELQASILDLKLQKINSLIKKRRRIAHIYNEALKNTSLITPTFQGYDGSGWVDFNATIGKAKSLTEQKRYYISNYGFSNYIDYINCKTDTLIKDKDNYDKFELEKIVQWWKQKATNRYESLKNEGRLRTKLEVWTNDHDIDIMR